ncbi:Uma2 family endonuclease [Sorangium sp. So ce315]|uniref:Uma2 family endonuclease n=1 Tax=Sorangium sp. So ce315 TaxID=3133299 RepID=UPI003F5EF938
MTARTNGLLPRPPRDTGPIELRDFGPTGRRLGTEADCYDGSPWELHRGELIEQMGSKDIHGIVMALIAALFRTHAREGLTVMTDVYCDLSDPAGPSLRAPDVVLVGDLSSPRNDAYRGTPVLAVEIRGTQSRRYLEEKVKLYLEHEWPWVWIAHAERRELEVVRPGTASITYRPGAEVPLLPELGKHGLGAVPVAALFEERDASRFTDEWVEARTQARTQARAILAVLSARGLAVPEAVRARVLACEQPAALERWLTSAATAASAEAFAAAVDRG